MTKKQLLKPAFLLVIFLSACVNNVLAVEKEIKKINPDIVGDIAKDEDQGNPDRIIIIRKDIERMKAHTLVELLNRLPGISATDSAVSFWGSHAKQILVLLDGRRLNNSADAHRAVDCV